MPAFSIPVVGGNVSLYNEAGSGPIFPTPVVGLVGELPKVARSGRLGFAEEGDVVAVISAGSWAPASTGSELAKLRGEAPWGELPAADLGELRALHAAVRQAVRAGRCAPRTTWPRAASPSRWPRRAWRAATARRST